MKKTSRFRVLTPEQYERLTPEARLAYIEDALRIRKLGKAPPPRHGASSSEDKPEVRTRRPKLRRGQK